VLAVTAIVNVPKLNANPHVARVAIVKDLVAFDDAVVAPHIDTRSECSNASTLVVVDRVVPEDVFMSCRGEILPDKNPIGAIVVDGTTLDVNVSRVLIDPNSGTCSVVNLAIPDRDMGSLDMDRISHGTIPVPVSEMQTIARNVRLVFINEKWSIECSNHNIGAVKDRRCTSPVGSERNRRPRSTR
jgi:hypothetical protein